MGKGSQLELIENKSNDCESSNLKEYDWKEIKNNKKWIVIDSIVYDVEKFSKKHPGGQRLMLNHIGEDVTDAFTAFHTDMNKVNKYLKPLKIGKLSSCLTNPAENDKKCLIEDFRQLRSLAEKMNLFEPSFVFFFLHFLQIIFLDLIGWYILYKSGFESCSSYFIAVILLVTAQAQAGWLQHDFGHLSVFKSSKMNHFMHHVIISTIKGVSSDWWNYRHYQHHAKPNTIRKDPDIRFGSLLVLGKIIPKELGEQKKGKMPYNLQHYYFFMLMPPLLLPLYFNFENVYFLIKRKDFKEASWVLTFLIRWGILFVPVLGVIGAIKLYILVRFIESHWFVWTTQMSHLPMNIDRDKEYNWFISQLMATCNVEQSLFNDWFSGHLNFQIEHHLFPTMPRHNYYKIAPYVKSICNKYNIEYQNKTLLGAFADIYHCLKESGEMWYEAYNM